MIELAVFDVAGTTVNEGGTVYRVLAETVRAAGGDPSPQQIEQWMGASKREAIQALLTAAGADASDPVVDAAFADFRARLAAAYRAEPPVAFDGVPQAIERLRSSGVKVALTTGFDRETTASLLGSLGWDSTVVDAVVCIDDVMAGRPAPFMVFHAMEATGVRDVRRVLVAGDTVRDVESGRNAGAAVVVAVRTGHVPDTTLGAAGPTHLLDGVAGIPGLLASRS
ncbi:phosphonatase-like hydrolase [Actinoplanes sp. TBRC 11911]|uniref:phosphonatase-like hydrolase n=1 Tax=Actinoplanes sp. TBRC 11911 TaxID=2729386 RepID=UPI00145D6D31|nr:phosphonatase-like hydrolase [Actinoplanes sp. TBRC 11911]NMO49721.1 phosphonatase-like hydrolase [Actinoplanes sp. TBRC 11911]